MLAIIETGVQKYGTTLRSIKNRGFRTKKTYLTVLGMMCKHKTGGNPVLEMGLLWNRPERNRKFIDKEQFRILLDNADRTERIILILGAFTGMRRKEIAAIRMDDVKKDCILIHGKGHGIEGNVRRQPISSYVYFEICRFEEWKKELVIEDDRSKGRLVVFVNDGIMYSFDGRLSNMTNMITRLGMKHGIDVTCHSLRRLFCTTLISEGCPLETVKELMRHTNINTTIDCYVDPLKLKKDEWSNRCSTTLCTSIAISKGRDVGEFQF